MQDFVMTASDGVRIACKRWEPQSDVRGVVHIAHGMGEHAGRYDGFANWLNESGYLVTADDHRGHGATAETLGRFGPDGWNAAIRDTRELIDRAHAEHPGLPVYLFGHSMGAMLTQHYLCDHGDTLDAAVISGSPGFSGGVSNLISSTLARFERWRVGPENESEFMANMIFGNANKPFDSPTATGFEWLSRDEQEVQKYVDDPWCGFVPCTGSLCDLFTGARYAASADAIACIPVDLPLFLFSGDADPVHDNLKGIQRLLSRYRAHGLSVVTRFYPGGRHEMLNETNRTEVWQDVRDWLDKQTNNHQSNASHGPVSEEKGA